jgi:lipooligosaccharide transport system permease protein
MLTFRSYAYWAMQYRRNWRGTAVTSIVQPILFLAAMGVGLGSLVHHDQVGGVSYLAYVAPGLLAATALTNAGDESTWPVLDAIKWHKQYHAMLATPLTVVDVVRGHMLWMATRILATAAIYLAVIAGFGVVYSPWAVAAVPAAALTGMAFAAPFAAFAATRTNDSEFAVLYRFGIIPMFLFSGTFFPVSQLPAALQPVAYFTPLWHGVELCRSLVLGTASFLPSLGHVAYLLVWIAVGYALALMTYRRRLVR